MTNPTPSTCPKCAGPIPHGAPQGLCPKCVLLEAATEIPSTAPSAKGAQPPSVAELGAHFPELEVLELLGAGGMGAVYKARQPKLDRFVALKILSGDLAGDPAFAERFDREARVLARMSHPNIVTVFDSGMAGPFAWLIMEFVDGVNLRQAMQAGRFTPAEALTLVQDICSALKFAHEKGILHRDIKPENILIGPRGEVKIADFGIAKLVGEGDTDALTLTQRGGVLGSPHYMAPEQFESPGEVDQRADIYSLGVVFYELLTGELPIGRFALPSEKAAMDARIDQIVLRTLEKEREARFQSAAEVETQVRTLGQSPPAGDASPDLVPTRGKRTHSSALAAAIITAASLVPVLAAVLIEGNLGGSAGTEKLVMTIVLASGACLGIPGTLFGARAVGSILRSRGQQPGLGIALFAAAVWPLLLAGVLAAALSSWPSWAVATDTAPGTIDWQKGAPELVLPVKVAPHLRARFQMKYFDSRSRDEIAEIGELVPTGSKGVPVLRAISSLGAPRALLAFGMTKGVEGTPPGGLAVTGLIEENGRTGSLKGSFKWEDLWQGELLPGKSLREELERPFGPNDFVWNFPEIRRLHVGQVGVSERQIAIRRDQMGALKLVIVATER
jgi:tRNA A-37 threonylcarbamoyl transferase component Bud32